VPLVVTDFTYTYPGSRTPALHDISVEVAPGRPHLVTGANGSGKSTLLAALAGFAPHFFGGEAQGDIQLNNFSMRANSLAHWVTQASLVLPDPITSVSGVRSTIFEEVAFGLENLGVPTHAIRQRVQVVLERLKLTHLAARSPLELSGGQQQRVGIAGVLAMGTQALMLDEPTAQLDPAGTREVFALLQELAAERYLVLATHDLERAAPLASSVHVLQNGTTAHHGSTESALRTPQLQALGVNVPLKYRLQETLSSPEQTLELPSAAVPFAEPLSVSLKNVSYTYPSGVTALHDVALRLEPGTITAMLGANGSGKTTASKMPNGLLRPEAGRVLLGERDTTGYRPDQLARWVGYAFQNPADALFATTVEREVMFGPRNLGFSGQVAHEAVEQALLLCGLTKHRHRHPYDLLLNERRWLMLASILAMHTPVLILDEPGSGFDHHENMRLRAILRLLRSTGRTILLITHDMNLAADVSYRVVVMNAGRILAEGVPQDLLPDDALLQTAGLEPPSAVRLARELGIRTPVLTEAELLREIPQASMP
jgi:energy-coupling factor transporter ATP-binding protein EcfA2